MGKIHLWEISYILIFYLAKGNMYTIWSIRKNSI